MDIFLAALGEGIDLEMSEIFVENDRLYCFVSDTNFECSMLQHLFMMSRVATLL